MTDQLSKSTGINKNTGLSTDDELWPGDTGTLSLESRRALVQLLKGPMIRATKNPEIWAALTSDTETLRSRLSDVFLDLILDEDAGIAFTRKVDPGEELSVPQVLRTKSLTYIDTVVLLSLRTSLLMAEPGERVIVDREELGEEVAGYRPVDDKDEQGFAKKVNSAINKLADIQLLSKTETDGRLEISPALRHLFDADVVSGILAEYRRYLGEDTEESTVREDANDEPHQEDPRD